MEVQPANNAVTTKVIKIALNKDIQYLLIINRLNSDSSQTCRNAALTRGPQLAGAEGPTKQGTSRSNGLVGAAVGGADRDMDPTGTTPHWRRPQGRRQREVHRERSRSGGTMGYAWVYKT
jgi:hypothetical protein